MTSRIIIFAKAPVAGLAKTRLIPALGAEGAAHLARRMLIHALQEAGAAGADTVELCVTPGPSDQLWNDFVIASHVELSEQGAGDLGQRMARAAEAAVGRGEAVLLMGTDCPDLDADLLRKAIVTLQDKDAVIIPAMDGGYVLLGFKNYHASLFAGIPWSTATVARDTLSRMEALKWSIATYGSLHDIDEPDDLSRLPPSWLASLELT